MLKNNKHNIKHNINSHSRKLKGSVPRSSQLHNIVRNCQNIHIRQMTLRCYPDVTCTLSMFIKNRTKLSAKHIKLNIPQGILADIFYSSGTGGYLNFLHEYKNNNHMKNVCRFALCTDIETNPGPVFHVDASKTVRVPYSQGEQVIFGETAGQQCLAMCLCALIYNKRQGISSPQDLIQIMNIGNELYSNLSHLARQSFLMFTEVPSYLTVFDTDYLLTYSESYSGRVIGDCHIEGYQYCVPFRRAFELLLTENYTAFILTIDSNAVCIYLNNEGKFKIFDSHSRDKYGKSHPLGTCVLLEAETINNVILHFQSLYSENSQFELKAIVIEELEQVSASSSVEMNVTDSVRITDSQESKITDNSCSCRQCSAISLYSICYSILKPTNYWDSKTVAAVVKFGTTLYNNTGIITSSDLPKEIKICGTEVHVKLQTNYQGKLNAETESQWNIESLICHNDKNTGFLIWLGGYCMSCIFQKTSKNKSYSILAYDDDNTSSTAHFVKNIGDEQTLVDVVLNLAHAKPKEEVVYYEIQYLSCSSEVSDNERKSTLRRHNQNYNNLIRMAKKRVHFKQVNDHRITEDHKKKKILESKKTNYQALDKTSKHELLKKQRNHYKEQKQKILENKRANYQALDEARKHELLKRKRTLYKERKQKLLENRKTNYQALDETSKQEMLKKMRNHYKQRKQKLLENKRAKYHALDETGKQELLTKNMNYYKTMEKEQKQRMLESKKEKYQAMDQPSKNELVLARSNEIMKKHMSLDENQRPLLLNKEKEKWLEKTSQPQDLETCITVFKKKIKAGPFHICCVCNRTLYKKSVMILQKEKYPRQDCFVVQPSFDCKDYICKTCHSKLIKGQQPCQAVVNNLFVDETPVELATLEKLEQILIAQRIVFEKIVIMPKGQQRKIKGAICNVPVECSQTCNDNFT